MHHLGASVIFFPTEQCPYVTFLMKELYTKKEL